MTLEEQTSENNLQVHLTKKIFELEQQRKEKKIKYDKLVVEHNEFKKNFFNQHNEIEVIFAFIINFIRKKLDQSTPKQKITCKVVRTKLTKIFIKNLSKANQM